VVIVENKLMKYLRSFALTVKVNVLHSNLRRLQVSQSKCLRAIGNYPRRTPIPYLHAALSIPPIQDFVYRLTFNFFTRCPTHPNPFVRSIGDYTLPDLHRQYKKYLLKRPKHKHPRAKGLHALCFQFLDPKHSLNVLKPLRLIRFHCHIYVCYSNFYLKYACVYACVCVCVCVCVYFMTSPKFLRLAQECFPLLSSCRPFSSNAQSKMQSLYRHG
jgi:hypothetical protein